MEILTIIGWMSIGLVVGLLARFIPSRQPAPWYALAAVAILGSFFGGYFGSLFGITFSQGSWKAASMLTALSGSVVLIIIFRFIFSQPVRR